jgi:cyclophilin family peptidyl-prolyl cis-trans isomerase
MRTLMNTLLKLATVATIGLMAWSAQAQDKLVFRVENRGEFTMTLNKAAAPKTCAQIANLAETGFYDGMRFHRAERRPKPFLVQIGDPETKSGIVEDKIYKSGSGKPLPLEVNNLENEIGAVGLATIPEEGIPGDSQFYILLSANRFLNGKYTVFAKITSGMDVVQKIEKGDKVLSVKLIKG